MTRGDVERQNGEAIGSRGGALLLDAIHCVLVSALVAGCSAAPARAARDLRQDEPAPLDRVDHQARRETYNDHLANDTES